MDEARTKKAEAAFCDYDFGDEMVGETSGWESESRTTWRRSVFLELDGQEGPSRKVVFVVRFKPDSVEVEEAYVE